MHPVPVPLREALSAVCPIPLLRLLWSMHTWGCLSIYTPRSALTSHGARSTTSTVAAVPSVSPKGTVSTGTTHPAGSCVASLVARAPITTVTTVSTSTRC